MATATTTSYDNRTVDLLMLQGVDTDASSSVVSMSLGNEGMICSGIQKVAQCVLKLLCTAIGSVKFDPNYGTGFIPAMQKGIIKDGTMLIAYFGYSVTQIMDYVGNNTSVPAPADETLTGVELLAWDIQPTSLYMKIKINTAAGESRVYVVPVPVAIR
jgi:hypothetical protein